MFNNIGRLVWSLAVFASFIAMLAQAYAKGFVCPNSTDGPEQPAWLFKRVSTDGKKATGWPEQIYVTGWFEQSPNLVISATDTNGSQVLLILAGS